jgi:hypothetical protein
MNAERVIDRLRDLPPPLEDPIDRWEHVVERVGRRRRRLTTLTAVAASGGVVAAIALLVSQGGGRDRAVDPVAPATSINWETPESPIPGAPRVIDLSQPRTTEGTGTETVQLGPRPRDATAVSIELTCLSARAYRWPDGGSLECDAADAAQADAGPTAEMQRDLVPGDTTIVITGSPGTRWRIETTYVRSEPTDWATNANGQTYGTIKPDGSRPDLMLAYARNGRIGYVDIRDLEADRPTSLTEPPVTTARSIPVYESDGETVIGEFVIEPGSAGP